MAIKISRRAVLEQVGLAKPKPYVPLAQGKKVIVVSTRPSGIPVTWHTGDEGFIVGRFPYHGMHDKIPDDDLYMVQLLARDQPRLYFTFKELRVLD